MARRLLVSPASLRAGPLEISGPGYHHVGTVLRARTGDELMLFDGAGREAAAVVTRVDAAAGVMVLAVAEPGPAAVRPAPVPLTLLCALIKGERMDLVVQKATELGVAAIVPIAAAHAVVRLDADRAAARVARWTKIAAEAARQCGRADAPEIANVVPLADAVKALRGDGWRALLHQGEGTTPLAAALPRERPTCAAVAIGPEGGFEASELAAARDAGFILVGLGPRVLRAETAAIAAVAVVGFALGNLR